MRRFDIKSILLGIGIGVVLVSIMSMIYFSGSNTYAYKEMTDEEIKEHARRLGMVHISELVTESNEKDELAEDDDSNIAGNDETTDSETTSEMDEETDEETATETDEEMVDETTESDEGTAAEMTTNTNEETDKKTTATETGDKDDIENAQPAIDENMVGDDTDGLFVIKKGDTAAKVADKLLEEGLIDSKEEFLKKLYDMQLSRSVKAGKYKINQQTDIDTIIEIITK